MSGMTLTAYCPDCKKHSQATYQGEKVQIRHTCAKRPRFVDPEKESGFNWRFDPPRRAF